MFRIPGPTRAAPLSPLSGPQRDLAAFLRRHVEHFADRIGERHVDRPEALDAAADSIADHWRSLGYAPATQTYHAAGVPCRNLSIEVPGTARPERIVLIGAHYDAVPGCPGANDNATADAALLWLAERFANARPECTLRLAAFANEEPPFFQSEQMGSMIYARQCADADERIDVAIALDGLGYYSDEPGSQTYPVPLELGLPDVANFIAFVGNPDSQAWVERAVTAFRGAVDFPAEGAVFPDFLPAADWSDHWSFWQHGYPGLMVTDTLPFRYPDYHLPTDTPDKIDFDRCARVVDGLGAVAAELTGAGR